MTDKKYSITLSAKEQLSAAFGTAGQAANKLRKEVDDTNKQLKQLGDTTKRAADMGRLNS